MDDESKQLLTDLFNSERCGVLATSGAGGPYTSLLAFSYTPSLEYVLFTTSKKTQKFIHMLSEPRVAFLIDNRQMAGEDFSIAIAVTCLGKVEEVEADKEEFKRIFLRKNALLEKFVDCESTALLRMHVQKYKIDQFAKSKEIAMK
jgi:nitroimidazol reductase NimA-like FMN-containing flavoprotein (pyridoxamine 5'-phosphate oxidase superfamily)